MTNTNNGCACTPNQSIKCTVTNCAHHCQGQNYCGLNAITVGTHETNPTKVYDGITRYGHHSESQSMHHPEHDEQ